MEKQLINPFLPPADCPDPEDIEAIREKYPDSAYLQVHEEMSKMAATAPPEAEDGKKLVVLDWLAEAAKAQENSQSKIELDLAQPPSGNYYNTPIPPNLPGQVNLPGGKGEGTYADPGESAYVNQGKPTPYQTAKKVMERAHLFTIGSDLFFYTGTHYRLLPPKEAQQMIVRTCREDMERVGSPHHAKAVYDCLLIEPALARFEANINQRYISFLNGVFDLYAWKLRPHDPAYYTTHCIQCNYLEGGAPCPHFDRFLHEISGGEPALIQRLLETLGYILSPDMGGKVFIVLQGLPNSGKSVLSSLMGSLFNPEAVAALDAHDLSGKFTVSSLKGKALCLSPDLPSTVLDSRTVSKIKQLTGNDLVSADVKYSDRVQFHCQAKLVLATNHPLLVKKQDDAFVNRAVVIPFSYSTPKEQQNTQLLEQLKAESDGIVWTALNAYRQLVQHQYQFSGHFKLNAVTANDVSDVSSLVNIFARNCFIPDPNGVVFIEDAYRLFQNSYGDIHINTFSSLFCNSASMLYHACKDRARKSPSANPQSCLRGIMFREGYNL